MFDSRKEPRQKKGKKEQKELKDTLRNHRSLIERLSANSTSANINHTSPSNGKNPSANGTRQKELQVRWNFLEFSFPSLFFATFVASRKGLLRKYRERPLTIFLISSSRPGSLTGTARRICIMNLRSFAWRSNFQEGTLFEVSHFSTLLRTIICFKRANDRRNDCAAASTRIWWTSLDGLPVLLVTKAGTVAQTKRCNKRSSLVLTKTCQSVEFNWEFSEYCREFYYRKRKITLWIRRYNSLSIRTNSNDRSMFFIGSFEIVKNYKVSKIYHYYY